MQNNDITVTCKDCGAEFVITEKEKDWFDKKGFDLPKRCPDCRSKRKANRGM